MLLSLRPERIHLLTPEARADTVALGLVLDLGRQQQVLELVAGLREHGELTVLCAMHDLTLAGQYAERLLLLSHGRLVADGPPAEIATEALISAHYGADVRVIVEDGAVAVIPVRRR